MDFHSLPRKELQALCKQHRIPANMTNVAMADALEALLAVRGKDGVFQETLENQSAIKSVASASAPLRFSRRASARRQAEAAAPSSVEPNEHLASPLPRARRVTTRTSEFRRLVSEDEEDQTKEELSVESTPITSTVKYATRRTRKEEDGDVKGGAVDESRTTATRKGRRTTARRGAETSGVVVQETEDTRKEENADANEGGTVQGSKTTSMRKGRRMTARRGDEAPVLGEQEKEHTVVSSKVSALRTRQSSKAIAVDVTTTAATRRITRSIARASIPVMQALAPEAEQLQKEVHIKDPGEIDNDSVSLSCDKSLDLGTVDIDECCGKECNLDVDAIVVEEAGVDTLGAEEFAEVKQLKSLAQEKQDKKPEKRDAECPKHQVAIEVEEDEIVADVEELKKVAQEKEELEKGEIDEPAVDVEDAIAPQEVKPGVEELETSAQEKEESENGDIIEFAVDEEDAIVTQEVEAGVEELETLDHEKEEELEKGEIDEPAVDVEDAIAPPEVKPGVEELETSAQEKEESENGDIIEFAVGVQDAIATQEVEAGVEELETSAQKKEESEKVGIVDFAVDEENAIATQEVEASVLESKILVKELEKEESNKLAIDEIADFANVEADDDEEEDYDDDYDDDDEEMEKGEINELAVDLVLSEVEQVAGVGDLAIATQQVSIQKGENGVDSLFPSSEESLDLAAEEAEDNCEQDCNLKIHDDKIHQPKLVMKVEEDESAGTEAEEFAELKEFEIVTQEEEEMEKDGKSQEKLEPIEHNEYPGVQESPIVGLISSLENLTIIDAGEDKERRLDLPREDTIPSETNNFRTLNQVSIDDDANEKLATGSPGKITAEARDVNVISEVSKNEKSLYSEANKENEIGGVKVETDAKKQGVVDQKSLIKQKKLYKEKKINVNNNKVDVTRLALTEITDYNKS